MLALADWRTEPIQLAAADDIKEPTRTGLAAAACRKIRAHIGTRHGQTAADNQADRNQTGRGTATKPTDANSIFSSTTKTPEGPEPEFHPLDEILKREIHDQLLRTRTQAAMKEQDRGGVRLPRNRCASN